jgi:hypothetical protein
MIPNLQQPVLRLDTTRDQLLEMCEKIANVFLGNYLVMSTRETVSADLPVAVIYLVALFSLSHFFPCTVGVNNQHLQHITSHTQMYFIPKSRLPRLRAIVSSISSHDSAVICQ